MDSPRPNGRWKSFRPFFQAAMVVLILLATVVFFRGVLRDRRALERSRGADPGAPPGSFPPIGTMAGTAAPPDSVDRSEAVFRKASPSVVTVKIFGGDGNRLLVQGSGVAVGPGLVATNRHVVESGGEIRVFDRGQAYTASVAYADREYDLCALDVPGLPAPPAEMASVRTVRTGQRVFAIGAPRGLELSISDGLVSAVRPYGTFPVIQTNASISKGSSGGGLFDTDGRLVGITTSSAIEGQNINFALVADLVSQLPGRTADIRTLKPIVPVRRADDLNDKALLDALQESRRAIDADEAELSAMAEEAGRHASALEELRRSMDAYRSSGNAKAYNESVSRYNQVADLRNELAKRYERKRQAHAAEVERHNRMAEQLGRQERLR